MTLNIYFWLTIVTIVLCICLSGWTAQAVWRLWDHANSSDGMRSDDRHYWLRHPWRNRPARSVLLRSLLLVLLVLALFISPIWRHAPTADTATNTGALEQVRATPAETTPKQIRNRTIQRDKQTRKQNSKAVDSPGIHYRPKEIDPEQHIRDILKRTNQEDKK